MHVQLWQDAGLDLRMSCYGCISTGDGVGMIEVVLNAETTAHILIQAGGASAALFKSDPLANWIRGHNPTGTSRHGFCHILHWF